MRWLLCRRVYGTIRRVQLYSSARCYSGRTVYASPVVVSVAEAPCFRWRGGPISSSVGWSWTRRQLSVHTALCATVPGKHARTEVWEEVPQEFSATSFVESLQDVTSSPLETSTPEVTEIVNQASELSALGLGAYTPVGLVQQALEFIHVHAHVPWWLAIVSATVALRVALLPVVIRMQRNAANMANLQPQLEVIQRRMQLYREMGKQEELAREAGELVLLYRKHNANPLKLFLMPFLQLPIFMSFFLALRKMAQAPIASMQSGGTLWFMDLTIPDPMYILPLLACGTFLSNVELGGETGGPSNPIHQRTKMFLRVTSVIILPVSINFPAAMFMYWVTNSFLTTVQILVFKIPYVRKALSIPTVNPRRTQS